MPILKPSKKTAQAYHFANPQVSALKLLSLSINTLAFISQISLNKICTVLVIFRNIASDTHTMKNLRTLLTVFFLVGFIANGITSLAIALQPDPWRPEDVTLFLYGWSSLSFLFALILGTQLRKN